MKLDIGMAKNGELTTIIGKGTAVKGDIRIQNSIRVDGKIEGNVTATDTVVVGKDGQVIGHVKAKNVLLSGKICGNIQASDKVLLESKASIEGDIQASCLVVDEGAFFDGQCKMAGETARPKSGS